MKRKWWRHRRPSLWKGVLAGMAAGLVASWTMNQSQTLMQKGEEALKSRNGDSATSKDDSTPQPKSAANESAEDATVKTARRIAETLLHRSLTDSEKKKAGPIVHYAFGAVMGGVYGGLVEYAPKAKIGMGTAFGSAVWAGADEIAVPAFGLAEGPTHYPISSHASALAGHLVYGVTTEAVRRSIRREW